MLALNASLLCSAGVSVKLLVLPTLQVFFPVSLWPAHLYLSCVYYFYILSLYHNLSPLLNPKNIHALIYTTSNSASFSEFNPSYAMRHVGLCYNCAKTSWCRRQDLPVSVVQPFRLKHVTKLVHFSDFYQKTRWCLKGFDQPSTEKAVVGSVNVEDVKVLDVDLTSGL